jgi:hypothetical protein
MRSRSIDCSKLEIGTGILVGIVSALLLNAVSPWLTVAAWV